MAWIIGVLGLVIVGVVWWLIHRAAMRDPNNGNSMSNDAIQTGSG